MSRGHMNCRSRLIIVIENQDNPLLYAYFSIIKNAGYIKFKMRLMFLK